MSPLGVSRSSRSAVVVLPPTSLWEPIDAIRARHDRQKVRWMPHINLAFPFVRPDRLEKERDRLEEVVAAVRSFELTLSTFRHFKHTSGRATVWLEPSPSEPLSVLHAALMAAYPELLGAHRFDGGYRPHLTVGQTRTFVMGRRLAEELNRGWEPLVFPVVSLALLTRTINGPFEVAYRVALRGGGDGDPQ